MKSGKMIHRVSIQTRDTTKDAMGGPATTWTTIGSRACQIEEGTGSETWQTSGQYDQVSARIHLRRDTLTRNMTPAYRLLDERQSPAVTYDIVAVLRNNRDRDLIVMCNTPSPQ
jgi:head-tail adaptor